MTEETALTTVEHGLMPALSIEQALSRYQQTIDYVQAAMKEGIDYGVIPGTDKPTLFKPGAEKLTTLFGLTPTFTVIEQNEDWTGEHHGAEPFFYYWYRCQMARNGHVIAEADGSCNSWETKYRYRWAERVCPDCGKSTIIKGKAEYGGGWLCWGKRGGCGKKWPDGAAEIEQQELGRIPNPNPADVVNTIKKMAQKRALVAATLIAVNASEFFTQDLEDLDVVDGSFTVSKPQPEPTPAPAPAPATNGKCPICQATGDGHAPWCQEVDGGRVDTRQQDSKKKPQAQKQNGSKWAAVKTEHWQPAAEALAAELEYYRNANGSCNIFHMNKAALKLGYPEITDANLDDVIAALTEHAQAEEALEAEDGQAPLFEEE